MVIIPPLPFLIGVYRLSLTMERQYFLRTIPSGATWRLKYMTVQYLRPVVGNVQSAPDLNFNLFDADGRAFGIEPRPFNMVTTPAGGRDLDATNPINIDYPGGSTLKLEISNNVGVGIPIVSITFFGIRGWERLGG